MWIWLAGEGIVSGGTAIVVVASATHYLLGLLLIRAIRAASTTASRVPRAASELAEAI